MSELSAETRASLEQQLEDWNDPQSDVRKRHERVTQETRPYLDSLLRAIDISEGINVGRDPQRFYYL